MMMMMVAALAPPCQSHYFRWGFPAGGRVWAAKWSLDVAISAAHLAEFRRRRGWGLFLLAQSQDRRARLSLLRSLSGKRR